MGESYWCLRFLPGVGFVAVRAAGDPPNTGMADPVALASAFDRFATGPVPATRAAVAVEPSRREQRGRERRRPRHGRSDDRHRVVQLQLLPPAETFDLWLIDNQPDPGHTTLAEPGTA